jgi:hypothetical protein
MSNRGPQPRHRAVGVAAKEAVFGVMRRLLIALISVTAVAGCAAPTPTPTTAAPTPPAPAPAPTASPFPPRPATLRLDKVQSCDLLTDQQRRRLGAGIGTNQSGDGGDDGPACVWLGSPDTSHGWTAGPILNQGAAHYLGSSTGAAVTTVAGFGAVATSSDFAQPDQQCLLFIDVAPGQALEVSYDASSSIGHDASCQQANRAATLMLGNLRAAE